MDKKRYCLALDLIDDPDLIEEYEGYHKNVWPEILDSIKHSGIMSMEIYRVENRLFMIMETDEEFSFEEKEISQTPFSFLAIRKTLLSSGIFILE